MQMFAVEARRGPDGLWMPVLTVQEDLIDEIAPLVPTGPGEWRICSTDPEPKHPAVQPSLTPPTRWQRFRWWFLLRTSRKARH